MSERGWCAGRAAFGWADLCGLCSEACCCAFLLVWVGGPFVFLLPRAYRDAEKPNAAWRNGTKERYVGHVGPEEDITMPGPCRCRLGAVARSGC